MDIYIYEYISSVGRLFKKKTIIFHNIFGLIAR